MFNVVRYTNVVFMCIRTEQIDGGNGENVFLLLKKHNELKSRHSLISSIVFDGEITVKKTQKFVQN